MFQDGNEFFSDSNPNLMMLFASSYALVLSAVAVKADLVSRQLSFGDQQHNLPGATLTFFENTA
jgi:hypothetical protein